MSIETKDWIGDVKVFRHGGGGYAVAIDGSNAFHPAPPGDHNKPLCQFRIAHGLPSKEAAEEAAREWVSRQAEALGIFRERDARIAELEAQVRTAGVDAQLEEIRILSQWARTQGTSVISESFRDQFLELMERRSHVLSDEARRLHGEGE